MTRERERGREGYLIGFVIRDDPPDDRAGRDVQRALKLSVEAHGDWNGVGVGVLLERNHVSRIRQAFGQQHA